MKLLGENIVAMREAKGWTQRKLAEEAGIYPSQLVHIEHGEHEHVELLTIQKIADGFKVPIAALFKDEETLAEILEYVRLTKKFTGEDPDSKKKR